MIGRAFVATIAISFGLAGCGGSSTPTRAKTTAHPSRNALPTPEQLRPTVLTADDLGAGWTEIELENPAGQICGIQPLAAAGTTKSRASFGRSDDQAAVFRAGVTAYPKGTATGAVSTLRAATAACSSYRLASTDAKGAATETRVDVRTLDVGELGEERLGLRLSVPSLKQVILYAVVRRGDVVTALAQSAEKPDVAAFTAIVAKADTRLAKLVP